MLLVPRSTTKVRSAKNAIFAPLKILLWTEGQETTFLGKTSREPKKRVDMDDQTDRMSFAAVCPKGHNPTLVFDRVILRAHLEDGTFGSTAFFAEPHGLQAKKCGSISRLSSPANLDSSYLARRNGPRSI
jgi:hypothetical protein